MARRADWALAADPWQRRKPFGSSRIGPPPLVRATNRPTMITRKAGRHSRAESGSRRAFAQSVPVGARFSRAPSLPSRGGRVSHHSPLCASSSKSFARQAASLGQRCRLIHRCRLAAGTGAGREGRPASTGRPILPCPQRVPGPSTPRQDDRHGTRAARQPSSLERRTAARRGGSSPTTRGLVIVGLLLSSTNECGPR